MDIDIETEEGIANIFQSITDIFGFFFFFLVLKEHQVSWNTVHHRASLPARPPMTQSDFVAIT